MLTSYFFPHIPLMIDIFSRNTADVVAGVVTKCLGATKARTKELGTDILMMYVEIEKQDVVIEELVKGLEQKNPKAVSGCITALIGIVR
jgi:cytoskeleton-associated protein 5